MQRIGLLCSLVFLFVVVSFAAEPRPVPQSEEELRERLKERVSLKLDEGNTYGDLLTILREQSSVVATIDSKGAGSLGITVSSSIVRQPTVLHNLSLRGVLCRVLSEQDLTYYLKDNLLVITSVDEAKNNLRNRVYPVGDLLERVCEVDGRPLFLPSGRNSPERPRAPQPTDYWANLLDLIEMTVSPASWDEGGEMMEFGDKLLVVRQTEEVHFEIEELLDDLRSKLDMSDAKKAPKTVDKPFRTPSAPRRAGLLRR